MDDEWIKTIPSLSAEELLEKLDYCGCDGYYSYVREPVMAEIKSRLLNEEKLRMKIEQMKTCYNCKHGGFTGICSSNTKCHDFDMWEEDPSMLRDCPHGE